MRHTFMESISIELAQHGIATFRYNFPYTGKGNRRPDFTPVLLATVRKAVDVAGETTRDLPLLAGGKSMGGRMTSMVAAEDSLLRVKGLVFFGFPLHAPGQPSIERAAHLKAVQVPMLFLQGTRDSLADIKLIKRVADGLPGATLVMFEGADHSFKAGKNVVIPQLVESVSAWINSLNVT